MDKDKVPQMQVYDGQILSINSGEDFYLICCDCELTHHIMVNVVGREVRFSFERDDKRTNFNRESKNAMLELRR